MLKNLNEIKHFYWLDWLRFTASLLVLLSHARGGLWVDWGHLAAESKTISNAVLFALTRAGAESVLVFFVLSGFLVGGKLIERLEKNAFNIRIYVIDRITRIWIPLIPALLWSAIIAYYVGKPVTWIDFFGNILALQGTLVKSFAENHPLWSLSYEIWFYFLAACSGIWIISIGQMRIFAGFGLALSMIIFTKLEVVFLFSWILGASTYWFIKNIQSVKIFLIGLSFIIFGYIITQLRSASVSVDKEFWLTYIPSAEIGTIVLSFGVSLSIPFITSLVPKSIFAKKLNTIGSKLAAFSYTLYLTHYPTLYFWEYVMPGRYDVVDHLSIMWYIMRIFSCILLSWVFYLPFEKQTARVRHWFLMIWTSSHSNSKQSNECK